MHCDFPGHNLILYKLTTIIFWEQQCVHLKSLHLSSRNSRFSCFFSNSSEVALLEELISSLVLAQTWNKKLSWAFTVSRTIFRANFFADSSKQEIVIFMKFLIIRIFCWLSKIFHTYFYRMIFIHTEQILIVFWWIPEGKQKNSPT